MSTTGVARTVPDPSWSPAELLDEAEACDALSMEWLVPLGSLDPSGLSPDERLSLAIVLQRMVAVTDSLALRALAAVPHTPCRPDPALRSTHPEAAARTCPGGLRCRHHWEVDELAAVTGLPKWLLDRRRCQARDLSGDGPWAALAALYAGGRITAEHLTAFGRACAGAPDDDAVRAAAEHVREAVERDRILGSAGFGRSARRVILRHTPPADTRRRGETISREGSGITFTPLGDGLAELRVTGEHHKLEALRALLAEHPSVTQPDPLDTRTKGQRQVDLLVSLCLTGTGLGATYSSGAYSSAAGTYSSAAAQAGSSPEVRSSAAPDDARATGTGPTGAGYAAGAGEHGAAGHALDTRTASEPSVGVIITASIETLLGLSNEPGLVGDTLVGASLIRQWAADPEWARRAVTDDHGLIRTISRKQRHPARRLRLAVQARWQRCTYPGCPMPARQAQQDHAHDYAAGGETTLENMHPRSAHATTGSKSNPACTSNSAKTAPPSGTCGTGASSPPARPTTARHPDPTTASPTTTPGTRTRNPSTAKRTRPPGSRPLSAETRSPTTRTLTTRPPSHRRNSSTSRPELRRAPPTPAD